MSKTATVDEIREKERQLRNSRPDIPTNAEIGMNLINHLISQGVLSAKHLLPPKK